PEDYDRMMAYDIVILSDIDAGTIGAEGIEMLREYVSNGGALLVLGGPFAFSSEESEFAKMLPVQREAKGNLTPITNGKIRVAGDKSNILEGLSFSNNPACFWSHDLKPKNDSKVMLYAGNRPLMIIGNYGKGKIVVFLGSTLGTGKTEGIPFWEWQDWPACLSRAIRELTTNK
ncbi:MAG: glutamine amidotransferase, partial [Kiritimatiellae bacterium]|nr:glutamine amidotransferase [Kiritimatiellia bacterium]